MAKGLEERVGLLEYKLKLEKKKNKQNVKAFDEALQQIVDHMTEQFAEFGIVIEGLGAPQDEEMAKVGFTQILSEEAIDSEEGELEEDVESKRIGFKK